MVHTLWSYVKHLLLALIMALSIRSSPAQEETVVKSGDVLLVALPVSALGATLLKKDRKGTWQFTKGFVLSQAITFGLKEALNKPRPDLSDTNAFPSGHTSTTFQSAAFIQRRFGWKYGLPAYALAAFTGYSRINAKKHDGWDVVAGVIVGIGSTYLFTTPYQEEHMEITFSNWENQYLVGFRYKF